MPRPMSIDELGSGMCESSTSKLFLGFILLLMKRIKAQH